MKTKKNFITVLAAFVAIFLIVVFMLIPIVIKDSIAKNSAKPFIQAENTVKELNECSLKTAIDIGMKEVKNWSSSVELVEASSADDGDSTIEIRGLNGLRHSWNLFFVDSKTSKYFYLKILDNEVVLHEEIQGYQYGQPIKMENVKYNSNDALEIAKKFKNLKPGQQWAKGYHYELTHPKDVPILRVYGDSSEGNFSYVEINAQDGQILSAKLKAYDLNGTSSWLNF